MPAAGVIPTVLLLLVVGFVAGFWWRGGEVDAQAARIAVMQEQARVADTRAQELAEAVRQARTIVAKARVARRAAVKDALQPSPADEGTTPVSRAIDQLKRYQDATRSLAGDGAADSVRSPD